MSTIEWITPDQRDAWDTFVAQHPLGLIYHLSAWQRVLESAFKHIQGGFLVLKDDEGMIRAGLPVYSVRSWLLKNRTVSVPFATMCDPLVSTREDFEIIWNAVVDAARKTGSKKIEIRTRRAHRDSLPAQLSVGTTYKHHYLPLDEDLDTLYRSFHDSCVRRRVSKAMRNNVVVEERHDPESLRALYSTLVATRSRLSLPPMPFAFFEAMYRCLVPEHGSLYLAKHAGRPVGGALVLKFNGMWTAEYSGHANDAPAGTDQLLYWHAIQCAKQGGATCFSFGRTSLRNTGLLDYKRRWATVEEDLTDFVWYPQLAPSPAHAPQDLIPGGLYSVLRLLRYTPAVIQKAFGDFCYRHLG